MWRYWLDFILMPAIAVLVIIADCRSAGWLLWCLAGVVLWTLVEYWTHRTLLHVYFWHGTHERHHQHPAEYVMAIWWYTPLLFTALLVIAGATDTLAIFCGFTLGYVWFLTTHHWLHHVDLRERTWLHRYAIWHNRHHNQTDCNYGITTPVWDWAFGTSR